MKQKETAHILIIDDDPDILLTGEIVLKQRFSKVSCVDRPEKAKSILDTGEVEVLLLDMNYSPGANDGKEGLDWISKINDLYPEIKIIIITAYGELTLAVEAMKRGATDFVTKPWEYEKIQVSVSNALKLARTEKEIIRLESKQQGLKQNLVIKSDQVIAESKEMKSVLQMAEKVSRTDANVLLLGENGTGKGLMAKLIHELSPRSAEVFMSVDLGSITESLFESELFGHKKGAFTDAKEDRMGRFEAADGGTIFLDEIGNLTSAMQSKLLTVIQNRELTRVGENKTRTFDVRIIAATNSDLEAMIEKGEFREDLFYRLNTIEFDLPPLRDRLADIPPMVDFFITKFCKKYGQNIPEIQSEAIAKLKKYRWPGNIRELEHAVERAIILSDGVRLMSEDFNLKKTVKSEGFISTTNLEELERLTIERVIKSNEGNMSQVAKELGIGRTTLYRKLEKYGFQ
ncbi:sigma-54-dependent transcriptional regulator [Roseivirga misakiensis]|uniref:Sigma-54-dependent Fis family transcriptional regulator n=1 Tax=Roseivirga misakiensis TaxID=1563681 RepID=A0A1E5T5P7_9BACT|nr:sigma-54 dependent transcriptional regulator [Roseivirga misakiensis]OEK06695.1 sigma-54-dependent Fis family transcriptional regulator [Roseivirga misakiensis]